MSIRVLMVTVCLLVAADLLLLVPASYFFGWVLPLAETVGSAAIGALAISYYGWRWSGVVAGYLREDEPGPMFGFCVEKILLLAAGAFLIIPGVLSTAVGLILLLPWVRRLIAHALLPCA